MAPTHGKVSLESHGTGSKVCMWNGVAGGRGKSRYLGRDTRDAPPMGIALPGGELGVSTH